MVGFGAPWGRSLRPGPTLGEPLGSSPFSPAVYGTRVRSLGKAKVPGGIAGARENGTIRVPWAFRQRAGLLLRVRTLKAVIPRSKVGNLGSSSPGIHRIMHPLTLRPEGPYYKSPGQRPGDRCLTGERSPGPGGPKALQGRASEIGAPRWGFAKDGIYASPEAGFPRYATHGVAVAFYSAALRA